jgi:phage major head subunit gpT-like protein
MAIDVTAFSALARAEFMQGKLAADSAPIPANFNTFVTTLGSKVRVETHTFMSNLPRLREFKGWSPATGIVSQPYTVANKEYRAGPVKVKKTDLDDDQVGGYLLTVKGLPAQAQKDIGFRTLDHLAAGTTNTCFDGSAFFADSHTIGSGDNLMTADNTGNDGVTHKIVALVLTNPSIKPVIFQDREPLGGLQTDADTPQAALQKEYLYWADTRFGFGYGFWHDAIHMTITDTPTFTELQGHIRDIINRFRTFTLPKGSDVDTAMKVHEGWTPEASNLTLLCSMQLAEQLETIRTAELTSAGTSGAPVTNMYKNRFTLIPTSALD